MQAPARARAAVPVLPRPSGTHLVGSVVFRWTDLQRPETFATTTGEQRQVVAQAWYPTEAPGPPVPYFEAQGRLPACVDPYPAWFYGDFDQVDTHATAAAPVSAERPASPVLVVLPGWGTPRESYSGLCADLASRGDVVIALSHPCESAVSVLADGRVVGATVNASVLGANMADMTPIRAADSSFVLEQLSRIAQAEPGSPLVGHLDVGHTGIVGHSMGGAAAAQDPRFLVGVNLDGTLPAALVGGWHPGAPFLWLQRDGQQQASYLQVRDALVDGRGMLGDSARPAAVDDITWDTSEVIAAFVGPYLGSPGEQTLMTSARVGQPSDTSSTSLHSLRVDGRSHVDGWLGSRVALSIHAEIASASAIRPCGSATRVHAIRGLGSWSGALPVLRASCGASLHGIWTPMNRSTRRTHASHTPAAPAITRIGSVAFIQSARAGGVTRCLRQRTF